MKNLKINILSHLYYSPLTELAQLTRAVKHSEYNFFFNLSAVTSADILKEDALNKNHEGCLIIRSSNKGKDIGGKLALIDLSLSLKQEPDYYIFLHDKQSPHTSLGDSWRKKLFRIIQYENIQSIIKLFERNKKIGIVCAKEFIMNEYDDKKKDFTCSNNLILKELINKYDLNLSTHDFVGGTMFWVRAEIITSFFKKYSPLDIRTNLEMGNVLDNQQGTFTHAWERMLSWIAIDQGYYIKGI